MKYMLLIYSNTANWEVLSEADRVGVFAEVDMIMKELADSGEWVGGDALVDESQTKTVRVRDGVPVVTDGPFAEAKEHLAGYVMVECDSLERAIDIARRWPDARFGRMEVRPVIESASPQT